MKYLVLGLIVVSSISLNAQKSSAKKVLSSNSTYVYKMVESKEGGWQTRELLKVCQLTKPIHIDGIIVTSVVVAKSKDCPK